jgi:hypothetical protein
LPRQDNACGEQRDRQQAAGEIAHDLDSGRDDRSHQADQRRRSRNTPTDHRVATFPSSKPARRGPRSLTQRSLPRSKPLSAAGYAE